MDNNRLDLLDRRFREQTAAVDNLAGDIQHFQPLLDNVLDRQRADMSEIRKMFSLIMTSNAAINERLDELESYSRENTDSLEDLRTDISDLKATRPPTSEARGAAANKSHYPYQQPALFTDPHCPVYAIPAAPTTFGNMPYLPQKHVGTMPYVPQKNVGAVNNTGSPPSSLGEPDIGS